MFSKTNSIFTSFFNLDIKNKFLLVFAIILMISSIAVGTYAFYSATKTNSAISGTVASAELELKVTKVAGGDILVPLESSQLQTALTGTTASCIDDNGYTACQVYEITIKNTGTSNALLTGNIDITGGTYSNLKWEEIANKNTRKSSYTTHNSNYNLLVDSLSLNSSKSQTYYVVIWINETSSDQNSTDTGTFSGTISFNYADGRGVTSTFGKTLPSTYQQVEYLESTGTQYIDTGITSITAPFQMDFAFYRNTNSTSDNSILGERSLGKFVNTYSTYYETVFGNTSGNSLLSYTYSRMKIISGKGIYLNNSKILSSTYNSNRSSSQSAVMFAFKESTGTVTWFFHGYIYYYRITENDVLTYSFIPCYRKSDNVAGMYDLVHDVFYTNQGTGTFGVGPNVS